ncbi:tRNA-modifying protein YgfZ [Carnimonas sp. R-84981]|uniref:CAF17-like 4Fe-4S cluster assembly/insertion protein YgfZ n=1 Tax=Carnimonas bestiolae TaxID=3402172 RepID=UPI003EDC2913
MSDATATANTIEIAALPGLSIVEVAGKDAERFLQGQVSANLAHADGRYAPLGVFCTPKGRVIANVQVIRPEPERYWLLCDASIADTINAHLTKYGVFFKATLSVRDDLHIAGASGDSAQLQSALELTALPTLSGAMVAEPQRLAVAALGEQRWLIVSTTPIEATADQAHWWFEDIRAGFVWIGASQSDAWLPQMINWEALGGISFKKGCYTGQEVVARALYRGQVKKRLARFSAASDAIERDAAVIDSAKERSIGSVVAAQYYQGTTELLAVVSLSDEPRELYVNGVLLTEQPLPYAIERLDPETQVAALDNA